MSQQELDIVTLLSGVIHLLTQPPEDGEELSTWVLEEAYRLREKLTQLPPTDHD
tara:strand:+ start:592 stop:753 length:162 start_codon:yes stop_codon:yes gene_type:complete